MFLYHKTENMRETSNNSVQCPTATYMAAMQEHWPKLMDPARHRESHRNQEPEAFCTTLGEGGEGSAAVGPKRRAGWWYLLIAEGPILYILSRPNGLGHRARLSRPKKSRHNSAQKGCRLNQSRLATLTPPPRSANDPTVPDGGRVSVPFAILVADLSPLPHYSPFFRHYFFDNLHWCCFHLFRLLAIWYMYRIFSHLGHQGIYGFSPAWFCLLSPREHGGFLGWMSIGARGDPGAAGKTVGCRLAWDGTPGMGVGVGCDAVTTPPTDAQL